MPYLQEWIEPETYLQHNGVKVYHVYRYDEFGGGPREYWYTLSVHGSDDDVHGVNGTFDVRDLPPVGKYDLASGEGLRRRIRQAIDSGYFVDWVYDE